MKLKWPPSVHLSLKIVSSIWIVYHLLGIFIMPSIQSIEVKVAGWFFKPYLNQLGLNTTWNLFSPDPATAMFMQVSLLQEDQSIDNIEFTMPSFGAYITWDPRTRRELYQNRF